MQYFLLFFYLFFEQNKKKNGGAVQVKLFKNDFSIFSSLDVRLI
jgi:predicted outer membrane repeat protein